MGTSFRIFRISGIDVEIHISLLILLILLIYAFTITPSPFGFANFPFAEKILLSSASAIALFASILLHELSHSVLARRFGVRVKKIMLFIFGGVAIMENLPKKPKEELTIAIAGPAASMGIAAASFILSFIPNPALSAFFTLFAYFNLLLALFNLIPAFPMDGGRALRGFLAERISYPRATRISAELGRGIAIAMAVLGIFYNPWLILIALFVYVGASEEERLVMLENILGRVKVGEIMSTEVVTLSPHTKVSEVVELLFKHKHLGYPVVDEDKIIGIVTLKDIIGANSDDEVINIMSKEVITISPQKSAFEAFKIMSEKGIGRLPVVENGKLVGIISRSDLMRLREIMEAMEVMGWKRS